MRMELPVARHSFYAFFPGISVRTYTDEQLAELEAKEQEVHTWHGKEYNAYEASQQQRRMETKMRAQRAEVKALQRGDGSKDDINAAKSRYLNTLHEYQAFSKKMKLPEQMERVYMDGLGRVAPSKATYQKTVAKTQRNGILKEKLKEAGLRGKINTTPVKIDLSALSFDDEHINKERDHRVTFEEAKAFISNARFSETVWKGRFERYYNTDGVAYVNKNNLQIRTAFKPEQFSQTVKKVMEVLKKYG